MNRFFRALPAAALLAMTVTSLQLVAQTPAPSAPASEAAAQQPVTHPAATTQNPGAQSVSAQTAPEQTAGQKNDESNNKPQQPGRSAREAIAESIKGNGGRVFGVLPNYRTTNTTEVYKPLRVKDKWLIASHDVLDGTNWVIAGIFGGIHQANDAHPQFGQGIEGYAKYYGTAYLDQGVGNIMTEGVFSTLFHQDPRYFRKGSGSAISRVGSAMKQIVITRGDSGARQFNASEWVGSAVATGIQNLYYSDSRNAADNAENWGAAIATDMASNILKEFWPDIKKHMHKK
jgi:hypothetical protein